MQFFPVVTEGSVRSAYLRSGTRSDVIYSTTVVALQQDTCCNNSTDLVACSTPCSCQSHFRITTGQQARWVKSRVAAPPRQSWSARSERSLRRHFFASPAMDAITLHCPHCRTEAHTICEKCHQPDCVPCTMRHGLQAGQCANCLRACYCFAETSTGFKCVRYRVRRAQQRVRLRKTMSHIPTVRNTPHRHALRRTPITSLSQPRWRTALANTHSHNGWKKRKPSYAKQVRRHRTHTCPPKVDLVT